MGDDCGRLRHCSRKNAVAPCLFPPLGGIVEVPVSIERLRCLSNKTLRRVLRARSGVDGGRTGALYTRTTVQRRSDGRHA